MMRPILFFYYRVSLRAKISFGSRIDPKDIFLRRVDVGFRSVVRSGAKVSGVIKLSDYVQVGEGVALHGDIHVGRMTYFADGPTEINSETNKIRIGKFCSVARNCFIRTTDHFLDRVTTSPRIYSEYMPTEAFCKPRGDVNIGNDVWIGANVIILGGVSVGNGAVLAAGSIVNRDVPPYSIVGGNPAKLIRMRFDDASIAYIESLQWWDWSEEEILKNRLIFQKPVHAA